MKIHHLPDTLISQIAAGEVIERPASALKELLENSLDAGATVCDVELEQGGLKTIAVRDNGCGMNYDDALISFARHATSKISSFDDLSAIASFGFRGEALAAIASVAHVTMKTRERESNEGTEIVYQGGLCVASGAVGCAPGTEIVVQNLFFNTPARKKFMKTETTELQQCILLVTTTALAYPKCAFSLSHNGRELINLPATEDYLARIGSILGAQFVRESAPVEFVTPSISIQGFIGKPGMTLSTKRHQYLFVNGRAVTDSSVAHAVIQAYGTRLPARTYPMFVLFIDIDPKEVDVNVHPRKLNVKFAEPGRIYRDVLSAVKQSLDSQYLDSVVMKNSTFKSEFTQSTPADFSTAPGFVSTQAALDFSQNILQATNVQYISPQSFTGDTFDSTSVEINDRQHRSESVKNPLPLAQIDNSYILINDENGLTIVDQHAAHERIMYEKFKAQYEKKMSDGNFEIQKYLVPLTLELSPYERAAYEDASTFLESLGFEFAQWSGNAITVEAAPAQFKEREIVSIIKSLFAEISEEKSSSTPLPERMLKSLACKAAVKFGMPLAIAEQSALLAELAVTQNNATCPHGRPTRIEFSFEELERRFYRRK